MQNLVPNAYTKEQVRTLSCKENLETQFWHSNQQKVQNHRMITSTIYDDTAASDIFDEERAEWSSV